MHVHSRSHKIDFRKWNRLDKLSVPQKESFIPLRFYSSSFKLPGLSVNFIFASRNRWYRFFVFIKHTGSTTRLTYTRIYSVRNTIKLAGEISDENADSARKSLPGYVG